MIIGFCVSSSVSWRLYDRLPDALVSRQTSPSESVTLIFGKVRPFTVKNHLPPEKFEPPSAEVSTPGQDPSRTSELSAGNWAQKPGSCWLITSPGWTFAGPLSN